MKSFFKKIKNPLILFLVNILLFHSVMYLGVFALGSLGISNFNFLVLIPSVLYAVFLLLYEKVITQNDGVSPKTYWVLTVVLPAVFYGVIWVSSCWFNIRVLEPIGSPLYFSFFGVFFFFTAIITTVVKTLFYLIGKVRKV